ncbi:hypothetical protein SDC9_201679 [bioreactor metagenome]|uniref:Uncharacterized protein n=1 Tax=bioreactor metagenome TaxID=1076179 RepID=A0A645IST4_9ZZZZ
MAEPGVVAEDMIAPALFEIRHSPAKLFLPQGVRLLRGETGARSEAVTPPVEVVVTHQLAGVALLPPDRRIHDDAGQDADRRIDPDEHLHGTVDVLPGKQQPRKAAVLNFQLLPGRILRRRHGEVAHE